MMRSGLASFLVSVSLTGFAVIGLEGCASVPNAASEREPAEREPAEAKKTAAVGGACFFDRFKNPDSFEIQTAESESRAIPEKIRGQRDKIYDYFKGRLDKWVHPKFAATLASCEDPMCFYEKVYGRSTPARLAYLFFLKTGMAIAVSDAVPSVTSRPSETGAGIADFLFTESELSTLIESAEAITSPTLSLFVQPSLRSIHKVPTETLAVAETARVRKVCGFTNGSFIVLHSTCLGGNWQARFRSGDLRSKIEPNNGNDVFLHELGHCVDYNIGQGAYYSAKPEWTSISEPIKPAADGVVYFSQTPPPGFVTGYAATSYREDFAESFAHFRLRPEALRQVNARKFEFLKTFVFQGRDFTPESLSTDAAAIINAKILDRMGEILAGCMGRPDSGRRSSLYKTPNLAASEIACVEVAALQIAKDQFKLFQRQSPEGCFETEASWVQAMLKPNAENVSKSIGSLENVRRLAAVRELMAKALDPKEAFLEFRKSPDVKSLYTKALETNFEKFRVKFNEIEPSLASDELKNYLVRFDFDVVKNTVQADVLEKLKADGGKLSELVETSFQSCVTSARVVTPPDLLKREFKPQSAPQFLTCGRDTWIRQLRPVVASILQKPATAPVVPTSARFLDFAVEVANFEADDRFRQRTEEEVQKLEKTMLAAAAVRLKSTDARPIPLAKILSSPVLEREDICRGVVRKNLFDDIFRKSSISALLTYTQSLLSVEDDYCEQQVEQNERHRVELEEFRNQAARIVYSLAFKNWPTQFPQDGSVFRSKNYPVEVVDPAFQPTCREKLGEILSRDARLTAMLLVPAQARLVQYGVLETCFNGRYAGRFNWRPSERFIDFGGIRSLGFAKFFMTEPAGPENRAYLYALKRYVLFRTGEKIDVKH